MLTVGSLFTGIGGFDLGLERAGMRTLWFCEQDEFCQRVLAKHWPGVPCHNDVRALVADTERQRQLRVLHDSQPGGQDPRSHRDRQRPASRRLRGDAPGTGGPDRVDGRVPVPVPYVDVLCGGFPCQDISYAGRGGGLDGERSGLWSEYARLIRELRPRYVIVENVSALLARGLGRVLGDLAACGYDAEWDCIPASAVGAPHRRDRLWLVAYPNGARSQGHGRPIGRSGELTAAAGGTDGGGWAEWWSSEPDVGRVAHGVPARVDRLRALGNALVPQVAEWIGRRIIDYEGELADAA